MGVKKKEDKAPNAQFGVLRRLSEVIPGMRVPTFADVQRIDKLMKVIGAGLEEMFGKQRDIFQKFDIPETEKVDISHPLFSAVNDEYMLLQQQESKINQTAIACFTKPQLLIATEGINLNYADMKLLEFWLVKS